MLKNVQNLGDVLTKKELSTVTGGGMVHCWMVGQIIWSAVSNSSAGDLRAMNLCISGGCSTIPNA